MSCAPSSDLSYPCWETKIPCQMTPVWSFLMNFSALRMLRASYTRRYTFLKSSYSFFCSLYTSYIFWAISVPVVAFFSLTISRTCRDKKTNFLPPADRPYGLYSWTSSLLPWSLMGHDEPSWSRSLSSRSTSSRLCTFYWYAPLVSPARIMVLPSWLLMMIWSWFVMCDSSILINVFFLNIIINAILISPFSILLL